MSACAEPPAPAEPRFLWLTRSPGGGGGVMARSKQVRSGEHQLHHLDYIMFLSSLVFAMFVHMFARGRSITINEKRPESSTLTWPEKLCNKAPLIVDVCQVRLFD